PVHDLASKSETRRKRAKKRNVQGYMSILSLFLTPYRRSGADREQVLRKRDGHTIHEHFKAVFNAISPARSRP
ncbi:hypothetical protein, partial [Chromobacterium sp. IRSSSOUMB001]